MSKMRRITGSKPMNLQHSRNRILIVDNNEDCINALDKLLRGEGCETRSTWSGYEALALMQSQLFDVLLVDDYLADLHVAELRT